MTFENIFGVIGTFTVFLIVMFLALLFAWGVSEGDRDRFESNVEACRSIGENWGYSPRASWTSKCVNKETGEQLPIIFD